MAVEIGSRFKSADGKEFGIITVRSNSDEILAYLNCNEEVGLDAINVRSIVKILFSTLNKDQQRNILKELIEETK